MIAYVIKNKNGKYYSIATENVYSTLKWAYIFRKKNGIIKDFIQNGDKVVKVEIKEVEDE